MTQRFRVSRGGAVLLVVALCLATLGPRSSAMAGGGVTQSFSTVRVDDIDVAYRIIGQGEPLLLIMGFSGVMDLWDPNFLEALAKDRQVIIFDNRGVGWTSAGTRDFTIEQFAADTAGLLEALGIEQADVLGYSMGSYIAQELVLRYPERVNRLILHAGDCGGPEAIPPAPGVEQALTDTSGSPEERGGRLLRLMVPEQWLLQNVEYVAEVFGRPMAPVSPESIRLQSEAIERWSGACDRLEQVDVPTLVLVGTEDVIEVPENSLQLVSRIPGAWLVQLPGGGHGVMYQEPARMAQIIHLFLDESA